MFHLIYDPKDDTCLIADFQHTITTYLRINMITDILGRPAKIGDTIITKGYNTTHLDCVTHIDKITKSGIKCKIDISYSKYDSTSNKWIKVISKKNYKTTLRKPDSFIIINEQLAHNKAVWPELYI